uniref:Uncharacterized protein n=1 Tax=viral metagenome TaxID=1070528 RepID=A0A6C0EJ41_9ZZZZ
MIYNKLLTQPFIHKIVEQDFTESIIIDSLEKCYQTCAFSTFPYIIHNYNSLQAILLTKSGNCISLSLFIKLFLKEHYNIYSYLIPCTIPKKYKHSDYLDICHVALAIPLNKNCVYIVDPAFYFLNPIIVNLSTMSCTTVFSKSIYDREKSSDLKTYSSIDIVESCPKKIEKNTIFNKYQTIGKNTYYANSYFKNDPTDNWCYFLTEIINPDEAITSFFIHIKNNPFITTTYIDKQGVCTSEYFIKLTPGYIEISKDAEDMERINVDEVTKTQINTIDKKIGGFLQDSLSNYINFTNTG